MIPLRKRTTKILDVRQVLQNLNTNGAQTKFMNRLFLCTLGARYVGSTGPVGPWPLDLTSGTLDLAFFWPIRDCLNYKKFIIIFFEIAFNVDHLNLIPAT